MKYQDTINAIFDARDINPRVDVTLAKRWSPRAFIKTKISDEDVNTLFDAARYAPSCFNDQPWEFYVSTDESFDQFLGLLVEANQQWARDCSILCFAVCNTTFERNGKDNAYAEFDTGAAWMSLAYQARTMGLYTHAMGGIDHAGVEKFLSLADEKKVICGIAIGAAAAHDSLDEQTLDKEKPTGRKALDKILKRI